MDFRKTDERQEGRPVTYRPANRSRARLAVVDAVFSKTGGRCYYCGRQTLMPPADLADQMAIDHFIARIVGGSDALHNLVPACRGCNCSKAGRSLEQFRRLTWCKVHGIPAFDDAQFDWLARQGFDFSRFAPLRFWFEAAGGVA